VKKAGQRGGGAARQQEGERAEHEVGADQGPPFSRPKPVTSNPLQQGSVEFVGSFPDARVKLDPALPEIAFIGRSNVGKSSLLNALVGRPGLARISGTPGKTTLLNFYRLPQFYLVDLPGYGFARASKTDRAGYRKLVTEYLRTRETLAGIVWLVDIRHEPSRDDLAMQELLIESGRPVLATFTKVDKLGYSALRTRERELATSLGLGENQVQVTSSHTGRGIAELAHSIIAAAAEEIS
jgi:GTP-binding protein